MLYTPQLNGTVEAIQDTLMDAVLGVEVILASTLCTDSLKLLSPIPESIENRCVNHYNGIVVDLKREPINKV